MSRPKRGTKAGDAATKKWRATMEARLGGPDGVKKMMQKMGKKGGMASSTGGFAANPELAREAGAKGGKTSHRGEPVRWLLDKHKDEILRLVAEGESRAGIARKFGVSAKSIHNFLANNGKLPTPRISTIERELDKMTENKPKGIFSRIFGGKE